MRRPVWMVAIALGVIAAWSIGRLQAQGDKVTFSDPNHATFTEMPNAGRAGVSSLPGIAFETLRLELLRLLFK